MKLTPFGEAARVLRLRHGVSMKAMADSMGVSSSHLSGIEYGEKKLSPKLAAAAIHYFEQIGVAPDDVQQLRQCIAATRDTVPTGDLPPDARVLVAAFARRLQDGQQPTREILKWLKRTED